MKISMKLAYQYHRIHCNFFIFSTTSNPLHSLQVENCDSNLRLVVNEDDNGKFRLQRVNSNWTYLSNLQSLEVLGRVKFWVAVTHNFKWLKVPILQFSVLRVISAEHKGAVLILTLKTRGSTLDVGICRLETSDSDV